ncbi:MAG: 2-hydroxypropyl-CoM lyase [Verrucomicrobia subdivision 3 bacterium]|nr:2-hydroxypropyl-CoM lyase [Limisphaerales bacterium]MCS1413192.1 2-hydroxypropyl-CoM lyase [Limisphaerales bacterium]
MPHPVPPIATAPKILTTTIGSYPVPEWLTALPSEQALVDATRVIFDTQRQSGIDLPTDGELYRFNINHPDTNGMIDYFVSRFGGCSTAINRSQTKTYAAKQEMRFRLKPAAVVVEALSEGSLNLLEDCRRAGEVAGGPFKFTVTSPYMLARTLLDEYYNSLDSLTLAIADLLSEQVKQLPTSCLQVDEANIPGNPEQAPLAAEAINRVLDSFDGPTGVHFCFGNYGGQTIQSGSWKALIDFLNSLRTDHLVLELAHRPESDLDALKEIRPQISLGLGVVDIKVNHIETADEIARAIEQATAKLGDDRIRYVHPDCGFWMLKRSVADRKTAALAKGRDQFLGTE